MGAGRPALAAREIQMAKETSKRGGKPSPELREHYNKDGNRHSGPKQTTVQVRGSGSKDAGTMNVRGQK